jgi:hypothetical protein
MSLRQAMREIKAELDANVASMMPNKELFKSVHAALEDIDKRLVALEGKSPNTTVPV